MENLENLDCIKMYNKGVKAYDNGKLRDAYNFLQVACSSLMFEITMTSDEKKINYLSKRLMSARDLLKEIKLVNREFASTLNK